MTTSARYSTFAVLACLYPALAITLIHAEGRTYRESLRKALASQPAAPIQNLPEDPIASETSTPPETSGRPLLTSEERSSEGSSEKPSSTVDQTPPAASALAPSASKAKTTEKTGALAAVSGRPSPLPSFVGPSKTRASTPTRARNLSTFSLDIASLTHLTPDQEAQLGSELNNLILSIYPVDPEGDLQRVRRAASPVLATVTRKEVKYQFVVLDSDEVNAFSLPGGYIYISSALFRLVGEGTSLEEDYALQFALAHEIAHVDLKHDLEFVARNNAGSKVKGDEFLNFFLVPIGLGYPDTQEFAADIWAYQRLIGRLDRSRRETLMFLVKFQGHAERNGFKNGRALSDTKSDLMLVERHYRNHPAAWDRFERLKALSNAASGSKPPPR